MRDLLKIIIRRWPWPLTLNETYDRQTRAVIRAVCRPDSICIDIGCFKGDILQYMLDAAPDARHIAFEPVPRQFDGLKARFGNCVDLYPFALGQENSTTTFQHVVSNPTYSGLKQRQYKGEEQIEEIPVEVRRLDDVISPAIPVRLMKIDVEGGEYGVLSGAHDVLQRWHPILIFEHGLGAADQYGVSPGEVYDLLTKTHGYRVGLMVNYLKQQETFSGLPKEVFEHQFWKGINCYFIAVHSS